MKTNIYRNQHWLQSNWSLCCVFSSHSCSDEKSPLGVKELFLLCTLKKNLCCFFLYQIAYKVNKISPRSRCVFSVESREAELPLCISQDGDEASAVEAPALNASCVVIQQPCSRRRHRSSHTSVGHLFLRLFQLCQEFASQMRQIPTAPSRGPLHQPPASGCWMSLRSFFSHHRRLRGLPGWGSAARRSPAEAPTARLKKMFCVCFLKLLLLMNWNRCLFPQQVSCFLVLRLIIEDCQPCVSRSLFCEIKALFPKFSTMQSAFAICRCVPLNGEKSKNCNYCQILRAHFEEGRRTKQFGAANQLMMFVSDNLFKKTKEKDKNPVSSLVQTWPTSFYLNWSHDQVLMSSNKKCFHETWNIPLNGHTLNTRTSQERRSF